MALDLNDISTFQDAVVTVMGLGRYKQGSGIGATKWLMRHGAQVVITDLKSQEELKESVDDVMGWYEKYREDYPDREIYKPVFVLGEHREDDFRDGVELVVQNPGVPRESKFVGIAKEAGVSVESDISLFFRYCPFPIYAITGTRGKSTTTALFGEMLKKIHHRTVIAGNIQRSPLEDLDWLLEEAEPVPIILELSSWLLESLENIDRGPEIAILTNTYKDHLDRYESFEAYVAAKELMFEKQGEDGISIANFDQDITREMGERSGKRQFWFSLEPLPEDREGSYVEDGEIVMRAHGERHVVCPADAIAMEGEHNLQNALAATLAAHFAGIDMNDVVETLRNFKGLPSRQETVREVGGVTYVNDTTATSPEGAIAALERFKQNVILIAGGSSKGFEFSEMAEAIGKTCKAVMLFEHENYDASEALASAIGDAVSIVRVASMPEAVQKAAELAESGDTVLLSPGAASFGPFKNEFDRGDQFVEEVKKLKE